MKSALNYNNNTSRHNMAIPDNNDMLSLLMQQQENSKVLKPPEGWISENCPWLFRAVYFQWDLCIISSLELKCDD